MKKEIPYASIDRKGNKVTKESHMATTVKKAEIDKTAGKAYGFFYCDASKEEITREIRHIRKAVRTLNQLELSVIEDKGKTRFKSPENNPHIKRKYSFITKADPDTTNEQTANETSVIMNQAYQSPLYEKSEPFKGEIIYKQGEKYVPR